MNLLEVQILMICSSLVTCDDMQWINPFDVDFVGESRENNVDPFNTDETIAVKPTVNTCTKPSSDAMLYYKRTINLLLTSVVLDQMSGSYKGRLLIDISAKDYDVLREFTSSEFREPLMIQNIDQILFNTLEMKLVDKVELALMTWMDIWYNLLFTKTAAVMLIILCVMYVVYKLFKAKFTTKQIIWYVIILGWMFDSFFTWKRMLQGLEIRKHAEAHKYLDIPADCFPDKMSAWQTFTSLLRTTTDCEKYYKAIMYDVMWDVGPFDVIAHQSRIIIQVSGNLGSAISQLVSGLLDVLPYPFNLFLLIPMMIFTLFLISTLLMFCTNDQVSINIMHLFQFKKKPQDKFIGREEIQEIRFVNQLKKEPKKQEVKKRKKMEETKKNGNRISSECTDESVSKPSLISENMVATEKCEVLGLREEAEQASSN